MQFINPVNPLAISIIEKIHRTAGSQKAIPIIPDFL